ncbi:Serine phosphatase RsbU, regulator of sigma subunit [Actinokineospora spheciospongiae]|uniref:Serine phosphatase RsbU, regulator of sigma subunit n=2 Tax=Actinokineospora spheciospongiae TaxID=909613 RepID=W7J4G6_9PSEU|nr:Serine phosphatase RsbU, regulator of sigma subunit [Actinokineospora spheciospongiae]
MMTSTGPGFAELVAAVRAGFAGPDGAPVPVRERALDPALVLEDATAGPLVRVPGEAALARLTGGEPVTGAVLVADGDHAVLLSTVDPVGEQHRFVAAAVAAATADLVEVVRALRAEAAVLDALHSVGRRLTAQLDIDVLVQDATDAATTATGAAFGAFFYNLINEFGESYTLYTLSGVPREAFSRFPMPRNTQVFGPTFDGMGTVRSDDITADPRFGHNEPYRGMPAGHLPVRSYLAVSAISPTTGKVLGGFFFAHPETGRFTERHAYVAEGIAGYAAIALDNARLYDREANLARELSRRMLPAAAEVPGLDVVTRYLPAATGDKVGGDWFDVLPLPSGATAFVIGDVVGHGVTAATVMGQVRTAVRSYALLELPPAELLRNVSQLVEPSFITCFYAVHDPVTDDLVHANAGHLPAVLVHPDGRLEQIGEAMAQPLGVGREFTARTTAFPPGADLFLYTDGLVETRGSRDLVSGMESLLARLPGVRAAADTAEACDRLIADLTGGTHDDDIALIHVHHADPLARLHRSVAARAHTLVPLRGELAAWATERGAPPVLTEDIVLAGYEAMANSVEHGYRDTADGVLDVLAEHRPGRLVLTVTDHGTWKPPDPTDTTRGRGMPLISQLAHRWVTTHRADGTTVTMAWDLPVR